MHPQWPQDNGRRMMLFKLVERPFGSRFERAVFASYSRAMALFSWKPCLLRPLDLVLRGMGYRWYGYVFLSNRLWSSTIS